MKWIRGANACRRCSCRFLITTALILLAMSFVFTPGSVFAKAQTDSDASSISESASTTETETTTGNNEEATEADSSQLIPGVGGITSDSADQAEQKATPSENASAHEVQSQTTSDAESSDDATSHDGEAQAMNAQPSSSLTGRFVENINKGWTFSAGTSDLTGWSFPTGVSNGAVDLPHSWEYVHPSMSYIPTMNQKTVTYTRKLDVSAYQGRKLFIKFYGVSRNADVSIDGEEVGTHVGGYSAFVFDITSFIRGKTSVDLVVKVSNIDLKSIPINVDYTQWGGIYRDVELISTSDQYVSTEDYGSTGVFVDSSISGSNAAVTVRTDLSNASDNPASVTLRTVIKDVDGNVVASVDKACELEKASVNKQVSNALTINNVRCWNGRSDPYLYTVVVTVLDANSNPIDEVSSTFGVRTFKVANGKSYLNGTEIEIHGVGYHQDRQGMGNAVSKAQMQEDVNTMLEMGVNAVRTSHYPHDRELYNMTDAAGMLVYNEIPYYMIWSKAASYGDSITNQLKEMIRQGYNNPSIVMWGVQNEVSHNSSYAQYGSDFNVTESQVVQFNKQLVALAHKEDPTRLVVQGIIDRQGSAQQTAKWSAGVDLNGFNFYRGFKSAVASADDKGRKALQDTINAGLDTYKKILNVDTLMFSEYGAGANINQHREVDADFSWDGNDNSSSSSHYEEYQSFVLETYWKTIESRKDIAASFVWNMFDFSCYRNEGGAYRLNTKGLVTYDHVTRKDAYYFFKANWNQQDKFVYLTSKRFKERYKAVQQIKAYSNCDTVELFLNGVSQGMGRKQQSGVFVWDGIDLSMATSNELKVVGESSGKSYTDSVSGISAPGSWLSYSAHVHDIGWQSTVHSGQTAGTTGRSLAVEALTFSSQDVQVSAHVQNIGWQGWNSGKGGTTGRNLAMEAVRLRLTGNSALAYDIYYRVHSANVGWLGWAKNGEPAGTQGLSRQMEAIQIILVKKGSPAPGTTSGAFQSRYSTSVLEYQAHVSNIGWQATVRSPKVAGTVGKNLPMEALSISTEDLPMTGYVEMDAHVQNIGWQGWRIGNAGTTGQSLCMEAVKIKLQGEVASAYDVYYRAHISDYGWLDWAKNGEAAGSQGHSKALQAIEIRLVAKGETPPTSDSKVGSAFLIPPVSYQAHVQDIGWQASVFNGVTAGTTGRSKAIEAIRIELSDPSISGAIEYRAHSAMVGWCDWVSNGTTAGTTGRGLQLEALEIRLAGDAAKSYKVQYRAHVQDYGWMEWVEDGTTAGTVGQGKRVEAVQVRIVRK